MSIIDFMISLNLSSSRAEARRLICQNAVSIDGFKITDINYIVPIDAQVIHVGNRSFSRISD